MTLREWRDLFPRRFGQWVVGMTMLMLVAIVAAGFCRVTSFPRCSQYTTQVEAQRAMLSGYSWLDGDRDGLACESLP